MTVNRRKAAIYSYYCPRLEQPGPSYRVVGWESRKAQEMRFGVFAGYIDLKGRSLLDLGCGTGDLYGFLGRKGIKTDYTGVDLLKEMVALAVSKYPRARFLEGDPLARRMFPDRSFDVVYASGVFNLETGDNEKFIVGALRKICSLAKEAAAVSLLHRHSPSKEKPYHYYSPERIVRVIERMPVSIKRLEIIEHYLKNDFTVICEK